MKFLNTQVKNPNHSKMLAIVNEGDSFYVINQKQICVFHKFVKLYQAEH